MNTYSTLKKIESPLNYIGGKYEIVDFIKANLPDKINTFIDLFGGGFNVGINIENCNNILYNDYNIYVKELIEKLLTNNPKNNIEYIENRIKEFNLDKSNKESYIEFRKYYNKSSKDPMDLYILILFGFQHQIRFNSKHEFNNPVGRSGWNDKLKEKIINFKSEKKITFFSDDFRKFSNFKFQKNDFFYCDPPYLITLGSYNDGKRGFDGWNEKIEIEFLDFLKDLNEKKIKFMLSNVIEHKNIKNQILENWIIDNNFKIIEYEGKIKNKRKELIVLNY